MVVNRVQGGGAGTWNVDKFNMVNPDLSKWNKSTGTIVADSSGIQVCVANGWVSQSVDFTDATILTYYMRSTYSITAVVSVYVDEVLLDTRNAASGSADQYFTVDVSAYTGVHTLKFQVGSSVGSGIIFGRIGIPVWVAPIPAFTFAFPNSPTNPLVVKFSDSTTADPESWLWDFGDGTTSTVQSPTKTYTENKAYQVKLTATNAKGSTEITKTVTLPTPPGTNFKASGVNGLTVQFEDLTTNTPTGWLWDFGENDKIVQNPQHTYQNPGSYTARLTATNTHGSIQASKSVQVSVTAPAKPGTDFSSSIPNAGSPLALQFTDQSTGSPTSWLWDFGDGTTSTDQNPTHAYAGAGLFTVKLTATNVNGSVTVSKSTNVQTGPVTPPASGAASPGTVPANKTARITLTGTGFKSGMKARIIKPALWGVGKIVSFSTTRIVFDFFFGAEFIGACGVAVISTTGKTIMFENAITVS